MADAHSVLDMIKVIIVLCHYLLQAVDAYTTISAFVHNSLASFYNNVFLTNIHTGCMVASVNGF